MLSAYLWLSAVFLCWIYLLWTRRKFYMLMRHISGPMGLPIIGMAHKLRKREEIIQEFYKNEQKYGSVFFSWLGPFPFLVVSEPQIAQDILTSPHCVNKGLIYDSLDDGTGRGLFSLKNPEWSTHRRLLNPAFGHNVLLSFMPIFNSEVKTMLVSLQSLAGCGELNLMTILQKFTLNVATLTTMGKNATSSNDTKIPNESLQHCYQCILETMTRMCFSPWLRYRVIRWLLGNYLPYERSKYQVRAFIRELIKKKLETASLNPTKPDNQSEQIPEPVEDNTDIRKNRKTTFIDIAIDLRRRGEFTWRNVEDESNVIVFGAFETTANTVGYTLMLLAMFPRYQQKSFEELQSLFAQRDEFIVSYEDTQHMVYMDMVLNEAMRLVAPVPLVARQNTQEIKLSNGLVLPPGIQIAIDIFNMHRRVDIWGPDAKIFNPENFLPANLQGKHSYAFIPFTKGIRNCIGWRYALLMAKVTLARLLRKYRFTTSFNFHDLHFTEDITVKFQKTPLLEFHLRSA